MNPRRLLVLALAAGLAGHAAPLRAQTPAASLRRVGVLAPSTQAKEEVTLKPFFDQMRNLGWIEGQNIAYDRAYADDRHERLPGLAADLAARKPDLIYAPPIVAAVAAKQATQTIPIVFGIVSDPVGLGLVTSLAHPGGNATGLSAGFDSLFPKRVELLRQILPGVKRLGLLVNTTNSSAKLDQQALAPLAAPLGLTITVVEAENPVEFEAAVARLIAARVDAILVGSSNLAFNLRGRLIELANQQRLPVIATVSQFADAGALFTYGTSQDDLLRRSALLVDRVLKGAKPADIPVEQPSLFELVINLKAAKALDITVPQSVLLRADRVIE